MNDRAGFILVAISLASFALCCSPAARAPIYPVADVLCVIVAEAAGASEEKAAADCKLSIDVVHDVVGQHNAAKARMAAASASASTSASGGAK